MKTVQKLSLAGLAATLLSLPAYAAEDNWYFRGSSNNWAATAMQESSSGTFEICQHFSDSDSDPRFKIDHFADWSESYPSTNYKVTTNQSYKITFDSISKNITSEVVSNCSGDDPQPVEESEFIYLNSADFSAPPTIWAWIADGSKVSEAMGYSWSNQQIMELDADTGFYLWAIEDQYLAEIEAGKNLHFIINEADEFNRNKFGCYNDNQWYDALNECLDPAFKPYIGPYLTLTNPQFAGADNTTTVLDPATSMVINYELTDATGFTAQAYYRVTGSSEWIIQNEDLYDSIGDGWGKVHHITLKNLTPATQYEYKVTGKAGQFSKQYHFSTTAVSMDFSHFLVVGDMQDEDGSQRWHDVAAAIASDHMDQFDFIITVGDMVKDDITENGERFYWWKIFFDKGQDIFAYKAMLPAMGNHDTPGNDNVSDNQQYWSNAEDTRSFRKYFYINPDMSYPDYYSYQFGNACFMSVNSEIPVFFGKHPERDNGNNAQAQATWLEAEVNKAQHCDWSFAYWHVPPINPAGGKDEVKYTRPYVEYFNNKLDWSITGHVHEYQRIKPVEATTYDLNFNKSSYGREADQGVGYMIAAPAGQWPRNNSSADMHQLAFYPHNENGVAYEIGFTIINVDANKFDLKTYGLGTVGDLTQPAGYRDNNDRSKKLLDNITYEKSTVDLNAVAGENITILTGETAHFDAAASTSKSSSITSYQWSNGLSGSQVSKQYDVAGDYSVTLTITDANDQTATDTLIVTVTDETVNYKQIFPYLDYRGSSNEWDKSSMTLAADNSWQIVVNISVSDDNPSFKFYQSSKWYGDSDGDNKAHSNESDNIAISQGAGDYRITVNDETRVYTIEKL